MGRRICSEAEYPSPLLAVAAYRLPGAQRAFPTAPLADRAWDVMLAGAHKHRVTGQLSAACSDGAMPATADQIKAANSMNRATMLRVLSLEHEVVDVTGRLNREGVDTRVLKGSAVANLDYADPGLRTFVDVDVLVRAGDIDRAAAALSREGFRRTLSEPRPGFDSRFDKGMTLIAPQQYELDLHRTLVLGPWGTRVDLEQLWDAGETFRVGGRPVAALSRTNRFLHACFHAALGDWPLRLASLRDVAEMLERITDDGEQIHRLARAWRVEAVVVAAVADTERLLGIPSRESGVSRWAADYVTSRREETWLGLHTHSDKTFAAQAVATVAQLPGWGDRAAYLRALLFPDNRYVSDRHVSALSRFWYGVREIRRGRRARPR